MKFRPRLVFSGKEGKAVGVNETTQNEFFKLEKAFLKNYRF